MLLAKLSRLQIKNCFNKRRRQQHLYFFKRRACSQRLSKAYHHWLLWNSCTTVNKVRGIEKEIFANYWRQKYLNGTLSWKKANINDILLHTRFLERCSTVRHQGVILIRNRYSQTRTPFRSCKQHIKHIKHIIQSKSSVRIVSNWRLRCRLTTHCRKKVTCTGNNLEKCISVIEEEIIIPV